MEGFNKRVHKSSARDIRLAKDWSDYQECPGVEIQFDNPEDISHFHVTIKPTEGYWSGASYVFKVTVPSQYPHNPPLVDLITVPIYHPNINFQGKVCLSVLRDGWNPVMSIEHVIYGLLHLFYEPNPRDPLPNNIDSAWEAAGLMIHDEAKFKEMVTITLKGGYVKRFDKDFPKLI